jgi:hypothetical protein
LSSVRVDEKKKWRKHRLPDQQLLGTVGTRSLNNMLVLVKKQLT